MAPVWQFGYGAPVPACRVGPSQLGVGDSVMRHALRSAVGAWLVMAGVPASAEPVSLPAGARLEVRAADGQQAMYRLDADPTRAWRVLVEESGVDLEVVRDGAPPLASPPSQYGRERLLFQPGEPRGFTLRVIGQGGSGAYRLQVESFPARGAVVDAQRAHERAARASAAGESAEARRAAQAAWREAAAAWRAVRRPHEQAEAELASCLLGRQMREREPALTACLAARGLARQAGDRALESHAANTAGLLSHELKRSSEGEVLLREAIGLARGADDARAEAAAASNLGLVHHNRGDLPAAIDQYRASLAIYERLGMRRSIARLRNNLGGIHYQRGEAAEAERLLRGAAAEFAAVGAPGQQANSLGNVALVLRNRGDLKSALTTMQQVLDLYRGLGDPEGEGYALSHIGLIYLYLGEPARAEEFMARALPMRRKHDPRGAYATARQLARARHQLGRADGVLELLAETEAEAAKAEDRGAVAGTRAVRAEVLAGTDPQRALSEYRAVAEAYAGIGDARAEALALLGAGTLELDAGRPEQAEADARRALQRVAGRGLVPVEAQAQQLLARAAAARGDLGAAAAANAQALAAIESLRARIGTPELRAAWSATVSDTYELAVALGMARHAQSADAGEMARAFALAERVRARAFRELFQTPEPRAGRRTTDLRARFEHLQAELNARTSALLDGRAAAETAELTVQLDLVTSQLHAQDPVYAGLRAPRVTPLAELRQHLGTDTVLLQYMVGERGGWVWALSARSLSAHALPPRTELEALVRRVTDAWSRRVQGVDVQRDAARLSALLLPPALALPTGARLAVVADGPLEYLPFAALPRERGLPLVAAHELIMLPSASALVAQRAALATRAPAPRLLAVFADPRFQAETDAPAARTRADAFAPLPGTRREAEALIALAGREHVTLATGAAAARDRVLDGALAGHRIVHLATHGIVDSRLPVQSGLMLARYDAEGRPQAGFLDLNDVAGLELDADLVVLSACDTALGREIRGEGLQGLTRGFMQAGARSVAATLWRVPDRATAEFVRRFYAHLLQTGATPSAALRATQQEMRAERRWRDPHHWAAFTLQGDWRLPTTLVGTP